MIEWRRARNRIYSKRYRERRGNDAYDAQETKRRRTAAEQLRAAVHSCYQSASRRFGTDLADWDDASLRTYKKRLDKAYPQGVPLSARYDKLRARYEKLELKLEELDRSS